jgi:UPF0716 protein FxsA
MSLTRWIIFALLGLPVAELLVFGLVAAWLGFLSAMLLALATSFLGFLVLRHAGSAGIGQFRVAMADGSVAGKVHRGGRMHLVASGILLFIPGFITDLLGLLILLPPVRRSFAATFGRALRRQADRAGTAPDRPSVIDLEPDQWHQIDNGGSTKRPRKPRID